MKNALKKMPAAGEKNTADVLINDLKKNGKFSFVLDYQKVSQFLQGKRVMVTGGGGSIGSELCRRIAGFNPSEIVLVDVYENNVYDVLNEMAFSFPQVKVSAVIASIRDKSRMHAVFEKFSPDIVFHAAAHKHVSLMEENPEEAVKNNVLATLNLAECAAKFQTESFVLISTDKAVNPTSVMGASKRVCEMIVGAFNKISDTSFSSVRFGNVLGSNGSVVPLFKRQIENGGPVTITDKRAIRYFMSIPEAAQLVMQAAAIAKGGEIFVLDMGEPVKIYDLAVKMVLMSGLVPDKDIEIKEIGLKDGEKLYEELLMNSEGLVATENEKIFALCSDTPDLDELLLQIARLKEAAQNADADGIKNVFSELIPTYIKDYNIN